MSFKHTVVSSAAALSLMTASAFAALETDGTGDYLLFPATYVTEDGSWSTDLKVVNTNTTYAVVARVVIRRGDDSQEIFDFPIYLTPGDVWVGTLQAGVSNAGKLVVKTSDDSAMLWAGDHIIHANESADGLEMTTSTSGKAELTDEYVRSTYVEVFGLSAYPAIQVDGTWVQYTPLDKTNFFEYVRGVSEGNLEVNQAYLKDLHGLFATDVHDDDLLGKQVIFAEAQSEASRRAMAHNAIALGDVSRAARVTSVVGGETSLNIMSDNAVRAVDMMEDVFSTDKVYVMYEGDGQGVNPLRIHFTDPVKKYHDELTELDSYYYGSGDLLGHYYEYDITGRDNEENVSRCEPIGDFSDISGDLLDPQDCTPKEVNVEVYQINGFGDPADTNNAFALEYSFASGGYMTYDLDSNATFNEDPAVIPHSFTAKNIGGMYINNHIDNQTLHGDN